MDGTHSGLSQVRILEILHRIRGIVNLPDDLAVASLDVILTNLSVEPTPTENDAFTEWERKNAIETMDRIRTNIARIQAVADMPGQELLWDVRRIVEEADRLVEGAGMTLKETFKAEFDALRAEVSKVANITTCAAHTKMIHDYASQVIHNASSIKSLVLGIDRATESLRKTSQLSDNLSQTARRGKERAARFRAQKKLDEAAVAQAGGNDRKAGKLRNEAAIMLAQDWAQIFPSERVPDEL